MSPPSPLPSHIYKILPHASVDSRYAFPIPIPASHEFFVSPLDAKDGFLHFSTREQLEGTLSRFFTEEKRVTLLKCDLARLSAWKTLKWDESTSGVFPHVYGMLEGENVESFKELERLEGGEKGTLEGWQTVLERARAEGWLK